jgi:OOP family OmpA-OmpF porin
VLQAAALLQPGRVALDSTGIRVDGAVADAAAEQLLRSALDAVQAPFSVERITLIHRDELDRCNVRLQAILERVPIAFVLFSSEIKRRSKLALTEVADVVKQCPGSLRVEGHTDNVGEPADNVRLSLERAWVVSKALEEAGVESARTQPVGLGETLPIASNHTRKGRTLNRRIELKLVGPVEGQK